MTGCTVPPNDRAPDAAQKFSVPTDVGPHLLRRLRNGSLDPTMVVSGDTVWRAIRVGGRAATVRYRQGGVGLVDVAAWGAGAEPAVAAAPLALGLHDDPTELETLAGPYPTLGETLRRVGAPRLGGSHSLVEVLVPTILGQKVQTRSAHTSYRDLCRRFGDDAPTWSNDAPPLRLPPDPIRLADATYHAFHHANVERRRAVTLIEVARRATLIDGLIATRSPREVRVALQQFPGVGPWTAAVATQLVCGDPDAVIVGDFHLPNIVAWVMAGEPRGTDARMLELLAPFVGQRGRAQVLIGRTGHRPPRYGPRLSIRDIRHV